MRCTERWKFAMKKEEVMRVKFFSSVFFKNLKCMELFCK